MTRDEFIALLSEMEAGWHGNGPDRVAACFAEDVDYADPLRYQVKSRAELRRFFEVPKGAT